MSYVVGVELTPESARAVRVGRWRTSPKDSLTVEWDPSRPDELVGLLRERLGSARAIALAVGLGFLHLKQVRLPPLPASDRRRILALEPDRFFPVQGEALAISLVQEENFAFAVDAARLDRWVLAFERWAPVENVVAGPVGLARGLGGAVTGTFSVPAAPGERGLVELHQGRVRSARRILPGAEALEASPPASAAGVAVELLPALGAARGVHGPLDDMLLPDVLLARVRGRRIRRLAVAAAACLAALVLAVWSTDRARERTLERVRAELAVTESRARRAVELQNRLATLEREASAVGDRDRSGLQALRVLAALSERLPAGATVLGTRAKGDEWQIEGTAADAAAIVPLLERDELFEEVRFLSASSRFREGNRTYETFSIAFRVHPGT